MAYPFNHIKRQVYPKTFLYNVHYNYFFKEVALTDTIKENLRHFFLKDFTLNEEVEVPKMPAAVFINSKDEQIRFAFSLGHVQLTVKREAYVSFERVAPLFSFIFNFLDALGVKKLQKMAISKYNELEYESTSGASAMNVMQSVFKNNLVSKVSENEKKSQKDLSRWEKILKMNGEDETQSVFTIEFGFRRKTSESQRDALTLKTQIESTIPELKVDDVQDLMKEYNQILDDAFHWCVSDSVINSMKGDKKS